jgi:hypothetical protein
MTRSLSIVSPVSEILEMSHYMTKPGAKDLWMQTPRDRASDHAPHGAIRDWHGSSNDAGKEPEGCC